MVKYENADAPRKVVNPLCAPDSYYAAQQYQNNQLEQQKRQEDLWWHRQEAMAKAGIEVEKKREEALIEINAAENRKKTAADIASLKELQKARILVGRNGEIVVRKELFGNDRDDQASFSLQKGPFIYFSLGGFDGILFAEFTNRAGRVADFYLKLSVADGKVIDRKLNAAGIQFGFSREKERSMRVALISELIETATKVELPLQHGWYHDPKDGRWNFCFPDDLSFKEVNSRAE